MNITFLGTGTSVGVPMIGCDCAVCTSSDPRDQRLRSSLLVESQGVYVLIDTAPDFRAQALRHRIPRIDAVLFTHWHADHILGFDDIRRYNTIQDSQTIPAYADAKTMENVRRVFSYVDSAPVKGFYRPLIDFITTDGPFQVGPLTIEPVPVQHGRDVISAYRLSDGDATCGYAPDCSALDSHAMDRLGGLDVMILDGLRHRPHPSHLTLMDCVTYLQRLAPAQGFVTHIAHDMGHAQTETGLPVGLRFAYDGLVVGVGGDGAQG